MYNTNMLKCCDIYSIKPVSTVHGLYLSGQMERYSRLCAVPAGVVNSNMDFYTYQEVNRNISILCFLVKRFYSNLKGDATCYRNKFREEVNIFPFQIPMFKEKSKD